MRERKPVARPGWIVMLGGGVGCGKTSLLFVLTHHARPSITMDGGTTFHFVTGGTHEALARAHDVAKDQDVRLGGGVATIREYLEAGLVDEMHLAIAPVLLGTGESLLAGIDLLRLGYRVSEHVASPKATHVVLTRHATP
jgi:dihydrofolate reductase